MANKTDIMKLLVKGVSQSEIAAKLRCSKTTVSNCARIMKEQSINAEALSGLDEVNIRQSFFARQERSVDDGFVHPNFEDICKRLESNRKLTLKEIWYQYSSIDPDGKKLYSYSQFCKQFKAWSKNTSVTTKMRYIPGQVAFYDWAGLTGTTTNRLTGRKQKVYLFVACLPYSALIFAQGFYSLSQEQWLAGHMASFEYFDGVPRVLVPDNCATATDRTPLYTTEINQDYFDFADYYGCAINPARRGRPRDKNMVESAVNLIEQWVIASLNEDVFYTLDEYNAEVRRKIDWLNSRPFQQKDGSRLSVFEEEEREELQALPLQRYEMVTWAHATVAPNSHVKIDYMHYSVPYVNVGKKLDIRKTSTKIEVLAGGIVVAAHQRLFGKKGQYATDKEHMPSTWGILDNPWSADRFTRWAANIGPATEEVIRRILASKKIVEQSFVPCQNILGLAKKYGRKELEKACLKATELSLGLPTYTLIKDTILSARQQKYEQHPLQADKLLTDKIKGNGRTRGADHYKIKRGEL